MIVVSPTITSGVQGTEGAVVANAIIPKQQIASTSSKTVFTIELYSKALSKL